MIDLVGTIGRRILAALMPDRRVRTRPRVVKRAISRYNARGTVDRTTYRATISVHILTPALDTAHGTPNYTALGLVLQP
ncbi:hypothetical protein ACFQ60_02945 [Streptomyces zhihengii]